MQHQHNARSAYGKLAAMTALSFIAMYILMYAMVDRAGYVYNSLNQIYMAALMTAPMVAIELVLMGGMYPRRTLNIVLVAVSIVAGVAAFGLIRSQAAIGDVQFIRSMIPHHSGAILMCREAPIADSELKTLCSQIVEGQQREINQMQAILARLK